MARAVGQLDAEGIAIPNLRADNRKITIAERASEIDPLATKTDHGSNELDCMPPGNRYSVCLDKPVGARDVRTELFDKRVNNFHMGTAVKPQPEYLLRTWVRCRGKPHIVNVQIQNRNRVMHTKQVEPSPFAVAENLDSIHHGSDAATFQMDA